MEKLGTITFTVLVVMAVLLGTWLAMGKRQIGEMTPFDFGISITAGTVAGAGIVDPRIEVAQVVIALVVLGLLQIAVSWLTLKSRPLYCRLNFEPTVVVENGQFIKANLRKARITAEMLLQLLREKDVFDICEVELAILEPTGKLSVLKKAEFLPVTPSQLRVEVAPNKVLVPVIMEGELQEQVLQKLGFTERQIADFRDQYGDRLNEVFVAFMDKSRQMHVVKEDVSETGTFLH
ncbi:MAG TPA: DUF421 domain-containing protein [Selenomonadales bacterium]|nr:DUF421 domain-containing protein [Selenomonadales bacterium]